MKKVLLERKEDITLVLTKMISSIYKEFLVHLYENHNKDQVFYVLKIDKLHTIKHKIPNDLQVIELSMKIDNSRLFDMNGSIVTLYRDNDETKKVRYFILDFSINEDVRNDPSSFIRNNGKTLFLQLKGLIRHEIEHVFQDKKANYKIGEVLNYYISDEEVDAYLVQLYKLSKALKYNFVDVLKQFVENLTKDLEKEHKNEPLFKRIFGIGVEGKKKLILNKFLQRAKKRFPKRFS